MIKNNSPKKSTNIKETKNMENSNLKSVIAVASAITENNDDLHRLSINDYSINEFLKSDFPELPDYAVIDPEMGNNACPWLDEYIQYSQKWSPEAFMIFMKHVAYGCSLQLQRVE